jgi:hAT family C-terminal dimerisation region
VTFVRDALSVVHDIGTFLNASALRRARFTEVQRKFIENKRIAEEESIDVEILVENEDEESDETIAKNQTSTSASAGVRKLCLTRWLARNPALQDVLRAYDVLQVSFEEFAKTKGSKQAKDNGIAVVLGKSLTYLGIYVSLIVFRRAEQTSRRLQQRGIMLKDAMDAVRELSKYYADLRTDEKWEEIWQHMISKSTELDLEIPQFARVRRPPKKIEQTATVTAPHQYQDVKTKHKVHYFELIDLLVSELDRRFNQPGIKKLLVIERVLTGNAELNDVNSILNSYPIFLPSRSSLVRQLESLNDLCDGEQGSLSEVFSKLRDVHQKKLDVLFKDVLILARIYLACPVTSVECERTFSVMRRLKTWLRRTTGQSRLNHELILVAHSARMVDIDAVINDFVQLNDQRKDDFGVQ